MQRSKEDVAQFQAHCNIGIILSPFSMREMKDISQEVEWMQMEPNQPGSAATGSGGVGANDTTLIEIVEPSSFDSAVDRLLVHLSSSKIIACPGDTTTGTQSCNVPWRSQNNWKETQLPRKKEAEQFVFQAWPAVADFRIWHFRSEVSSCASRPIEAMIWTNEVESAKSSADVKHVRDDHRSQVADKLRGSCF